MGHSIGDLKTVYFCGQGPYAMLPLRFKELGRG